MEKVRIICADCGCEIDYEDYTNSDGDYNYCDDCGGYFHTDNGQFIGDMFYCDDCAEEHYDGIMEYHDFDDWTYNFVDNEDESILKGFELEVEGNNHREMVEELKYIMGNFCVYERDGSLDNGFEIISNPFTMPYMYANENMFKNALESLQSNGYTSHNNGRCGLHVHVNRWQLTDGSVLSTDEVIDNILLIMETFKEEIVKFSRRKSSQISRWCAFLSDIDSHVELNYKSIKECKDEHRYNRYVALNLSNSNTIEFRIFRGTLKYESFMACIELVDNICNIAKGNIDGLTWNDLISNGKYVNDYSISRGIESDKVVTIV